MDMYKLRLFLVVASVGFGTGFQMYVSSVVNNVEDILMTWVNVTYASRYGVHLTRMKADVFWSGIACCQMVGGMVGAISLSKIALNLGRRHGLALCCLSALVGAVLSGSAKAANSYELLIFGRLFEGYALGAGMGISSMFLTEIAPLPYRGACGSVIGLFFGLADFMSLGVTLPSALGTEDSWPVAFLLPAFSAILEASVVLVVPESPRFLYLSRKDVENAKTALQFYQGSKHAETSLKELEREAITASGTAVSFRTFITSKTYRKRITVVVLLMTASVVSGIDAIMSYSTSVYERAGLSPTTSKFATFGLGITNLVMSLTTVLTVDRFGRRPVSLGGLTGCNVSIACATLFTALITLGGFSSRALAYLAVASLIGYQISFGFQQPIAVFLASEIFDQETRGFAMSLVNTVFFGEALLTVLFFPPYADAVGIAFSFLPFLVISGSCLTCLFFILPETNGRTIGETARN